MKMFIGLFLCLGLTGCFEPCQHFSKVVSLGQCSYSKMGSYGTSDCVALTEDGHKVTAHEPFVVGEQACTE